MQRSVAAAERAPVNDRREIFGWIMYDWANSVFSTTVITALMGPYLTAVAQAAVGEGGVALRLGPLTVTAESLFPYSISLSVLLQVFFLPVLGAIADYTNLKKRLMILFCYLGAISTCLLFFVAGNLYLLGALLLILANLGFGGSIVLYNAYLADITTEDQRDKVSSRGFAWGYMGGGLLLALNLVLLTVGPSIGIDKALGARISLLSAGVWWAGFSLITFRRLQVRAPAKALPPGQNYLTIGFSELALTFRTLARLPHTLRFLVGYLFYNDGIQTVITMSAVFLAQELKVDTTFLLGLILMVQFVAFAGAFLFERLAGWLGTRSAILLSLVIWCGVVIYAYAFLRTPEEALGMGVAIALVLGGSQALSRALFSCMIPRTQEAAFFGLYEISERGTSWIGPFLFGVVVQATGSYRQAILSIIVLLIVGAIILARTNTQQAILNSGNRLPAQVGGAVGEAA